MKHVAKNNFDIVRLILATLVMLGHAKTLATPATVQGFFSYPEVNAFFIISGYLVFSSFDKKPSIGSFYIRRIFRIYPLYVVTVLTQGILMAIFAGGIIAHMGELMRYLAFNLVLANYMAYDIGGILAGMQNPGINPSLWTIKIEVAFYVILPLLWMFLRRLKATLLVALYVLSTIYVLITLPYGADNLARQLPGQLRFFVVGMALYRYREKMTMSTVWLVVITAALIGLSYLKPEWLLTPLEPIWLGLMIFIAAMRLPVITLPTDISYGVYLIHGPMIQFSLLLGVYGYTYNFLWMLTAAVFSLAFLAVYCIEQPGIEMGKKLARAWTARFEPVRT